MPQGQKPQQSQEQKSEQEQQKREDQELQAQQQKPKKEDEKESPGKVDNDRTEDGPAPDSKAGSLVDRIREARRWGVLPMKVAETVLFSGGKEAPPEYLEIISRYYKRMIEIQSRGR